MFVGSICISDVDRAMRWPEEVNINAAQTTENAISETAAMSWVGSPIGKVLLIIESVSQIIGMSRLLPEIVSIISLTMYRLVLGLVNIDGALSLSLVGTKLLSVGSIGFVIHQVSMPRVTRVTRRRKNVIVTR